MNDPVATSGFSSRSHHAVTLAIAWLLCSGSALTMLLIGTRTSGELEALRYALHAAYSVALI
jgi:hypothetical protein